MANTRRILEARGARDLVQSGRTVTKTPGNASADSSGTKRARICSVQLPRSSRLAAGSLRVITELHARMADVTNYRETEQPARSLLTAALHTIRASLLAETLALLSGLFATAVYVSPKRFRASRSNLRDVAEKLGRCCFGTWSVKVILYTNA